MYILVGMLILMILDDSILMVAGFIYNVRIDGSPIFEFVDLQDSCKGYRDIWGRIGM